MTQISQQDAKLLPNVISFDINSTNFLGGTNFHNLLTLILLSLLILRR